jgi:phosphoketolase
MTTVALEQIRTLPMQWRRMTKTDSKYPFAFDLVTGRHGFKKVHGVRLSDEEQKALDRIETRLKKNGQVEEVMSETTTQRQFHIDLFVEDGKTLKEAEEIVQKIEQRLGHRLDETPLSGNDDDDDDYFDEDAYDALNTDHDFNDSPYDDG